MPSFITVEGGEDDEGKDHAVMVKDETIAQRYKALWQQVEQRYRAD